MSPPGPFVLPRTWDIVLAGTEEGSVLSQLNQFGQLDPAMRCTGRTTTCHGRTTIDGSAR
jgi:hypothetical protein